MGRLPIVGGEMISHSQVPLVYLTAAGRGPSEKHCAFRMEETKDAPTWDSTFTRFGASELNERFARRFGRPMTSAAWNGWFAIKALVETALRNDDTRTLCDAMSRSRFDGHKGVPLAFDPQTRVLGRAAERK